MDQATIDGWRIWIAELRGRLGNIKFSEMITLAEALGRKQRPGSSPPVYISPLQGRRSLSIHYHPKAMKRGTAKGALAVLEGDIDEWEMLLAEGRTKGNGNA